jgi:ketosteroid isomerase-like protein
MCAMTLPDDPAAFVAAAERGVNDRDVEGTAAVYAENATLVAVTDGAVEEYRGGSAIRAAWDAYLATFGARGFTLSKTLQAADGDTIANTWTGSLGAGRTRAEGMETWRFDADGKVVEHRMYSFLNLKPSTSPLARLRLAASYPLSALAFLREQRRAGVR